MGSCAVSDISMRSVSDMPRQPLHCQSDSQHVRLSTYAVSMYASACTLSHLRTVLIRSHVNSSVKALVACHAIGVPIQGLQPSAEKGILSKGIGLEHRAGLRKAV
jgi:hypothetical protein